MEKRSFTAAVFVHDGVCGAFHTAPGRKHRSHAAHKGGFARAHLSVERHEGKAAPLAEFPCKRRTEALGSPPENESHTS